MQLVMLPWMRTDRLTRLFDGVNVIVFFTYGTFCQLIGCYSLFGFFVL